MFKGVLSIKHTKVEKELDLPPCRPMGEFSTKRAYNSNICFFMFMYLYARKYCFRKVYAQD